MNLSRRNFLRNTTLLIPSLSRNLLSAEGDPFFKTRAVVLVPEDFTLPDWPERAQGAGLNTIAVHSSSVEAVVRFIESSSGVRLIRECERLELQLEYELHAMADLLPRTLFASRPELFRMNERGERTPDANLCVHSIEALDFVAENAIRISRKLRPTTDRFFYWFDDAKPGCRCQQCREFSDADQALLVENKILAALRSHWPKATLAHLAYDKTIHPPTRVKPSAGIFLEYAPIDRAYDRPLAEQPLSQRDSLEKLDANLRVFSPEGAQVLEYWIDVSRFSKWKRPAVKCPWRADVMAADLKSYAQRGIRHVTSFGVYIDAEYLKLHGEPKFIQEYGGLLRQFSGAK